VACTWSSNQTSSGRSINPAAQSVKPELRGLNQQETVNVTTEQIQPSSNLTPDGQTAPSSKKVRGRNKSTIALIDAMYKIAEEAHPITGRGIGYKLFAASLISGMHEMPKVYRALVLAREDETIPWDWIVDETRDLEIVEGIFESGAVFARDFFYRRDLWQTQEKTVELWSEKGTVRGLLWPVLAKYGVGFRVMHGFTSATCAWDVSQVGIDDRPLVALYIGDYDPSGMCMSERDIPERLDKYGGHHIEFKRIALIAEQTRSLRSFPASDKGPKSGKRGDMRYPWYVKNYGDRCWELDAMDPRPLRELVEAEIKALIDPELWAAQEALEVREKQSLELTLRSWAMQSLGASAAWGLL
jgi:hypothetical protein